jgi:hypothetical protein
MRSWRTPQRYNSVSGKGLSGWVTDTAGDQAPDYRVGWGSIGQNNIYPNWIDGRNYAELTGGTPAISEPTDSGGLSWDNQGFGP